MTQSPKKNEVKTKNSPEKRDEVKKVDPKVQAVEVDNKGVEQEKEVKER